MHAGSQLWGFVMRTKEEAAAFLATPGVFETRAEVWRALLEYNPQLHGDRDVDSLSANEIDELLKLNYDVTEMPVKSIQWKHPLRDDELCVTIAKPQYGYREGVDMGKVHVAAHRLHGRILKGHLVKVSVVRHYFTIAGMTS